MQLNSHYITNKKMESPTIIMELIIKNSLNSQTYKGAIEKSSTNQNGIIFVTPSKNDLREGKGSIVYSLKSLKSKYNTFSHWTPNVYRKGEYIKNKVIKGHSKVNLKRINVIGFDIDTKEIDLYGLFLGCQEIGLPNPNLLIETPRGYQGFFILETPFYIHKRSNYKALRVAERLSDNILYALRKFAPVDTNCSPFGFFRIPNDKNIIHFESTLINTASLISWSKKFEKKERHTSYNSNIMCSPSHLSPTSSDWYKRLLKAKDIKSGYHSSSRNNTIFTLAVANYSSGCSFKKAYDELYRFNNSLSSPLNSREFERTLRSAYSGKYKGPKRSYVEGLLGLWTEGNVKFESKGGWYKFKKPREERIRSHYEEREKDILSYLNVYLTPQNPYLRGSLTSLAKRLGMASSTLKEVLKRSKKIVKQTFGRGRGAVTFIASRSMLIKRLLICKQLRVQKININRLMFLRKNDHQTLLICKVQYIENIGDIIKIKNKPLCRYMSMALLFKHLGRFLL